LSVGRSRYRRERRLRRNGKLVRQDYRIFRIYKILSC